MTDIETAAFTITVIGRLLLGLDGVDTNKVFAPELLAQLVQGQALGPQALFFFLTNNSIEGPAVNWGSMTA